jgi:hypothetical protein
MSNLPGKDLGDVEQFDAAPGSSVPGRERAVKKLTAL